MLPSRSVLSLEQRFSLHLLSLPRWFALPVALVSITMGGLLTGASWGNLALALLTGTFLMAFAHSTNSWLDWVIGFDRGPQGERSRKKSYSGAQNLIAEGKVSVSEVALNSIGWLMLALAGAIALGLYTFPWGWLPFGGIVACAYTYSFAKKVWVPEVPLCLGFATFAIWLGMAASGEIAFVQGALASIPLFLIWASAELVDQYLDCEVNIGKGLRSLAVLAYYYDILPELLAVEIMVAYFALMGVIGLGVLSPWTFLSVLALPHLAFTVARITTQTEKAIKVGLVGVFLFGALITLGQIIG